MSVTDKARDFLHDAYCDDDFADGVYQQVLAALDVVEAAEMIPLCECEVERPCPHTKRLMKALDKFKEASE